MNEGQKVAYISIALSVLSVVVTLATGFISITNTVSILTVKVGEMREDLKLSVRIQVEERGMREGIAKSQEWAEIASRKKAIAERAWKRQV